MRTLNTKPMIVLAALIAIAMTGCGKNKGNETAPGTPGYGGYPNGQYPQGNYPGGGAGPLQSACTPVGGPLSFQGGFNVNSVSIVSGQSTPNGYIVNARSINGMQMGKIYSDATMDINVQNGGGGGVITLTPTFIWSHFNGNPSICASVVEINVGYASSPYGLYPYGGYARLAINGGQVVTVQF